MAQHMICAAQKRVLNVNDKTGIHMHSLNSAESHDVDAGASFERPRH